MVLIALEAIDKAIDQYLIEERMDSPHHFYLFRDQSLRYCLAQVRSVTINRKELTRALILLNEVDMIFRFTAARKFGVRDSAEKQLRINSWGKLYLVESGALDHYRVVYQKYITFVKTQLTAQRPTYHELMALLSAPITAEAAAQIRELNEQLKITLVS